MPVREVRLPPATERIRGGVAARPLFCSAFVICFGDGRHTGRRPVHAPGDGTASRRASSTRRTGGIAAMDSFTFEGVSCQQYDCLKLAWDSPAGIPQQAGVLILAAGDASAPVPVLIEPCHSLRTSFFEHGIRAATNHGATMVFIRATGRDWKLARAEAADLGAQYQPVMNSRSS